MEPSNKLPLFIVTGASCVGKSTACEVLFRQEKDYIVMESDLLWSMSYNTPEDNYCAYRRLWMRVAANIAQIRKPVVLCGCALPEQFETQPERNYFTQIHYLAVVCDDAHMERRIRGGRQVTDEGWVKSAMDFNIWLKNNAGCTVPGIALLDNSTLTPEQTAEQIDRWIMKIMRG